MRRSLALTLVVLGACELRQDLGRLPATSNDGSDGGASFPNFPSTTTRAGWRWVSPYPTGDDLRGVFSAPAGDLWLLGASGTVLRREISGAIVEMLEPDAETRWYTGFATAPDDVWIVGERRGATDVRRWDGHRWTGDYSLRDDPVHAIAGASRDVAWAAASVFGAVWNGAEWAITPAETTAPMRALWSPGESDAWGVGDRGALLHWESGTFRDTRPVVATPAYEADRNYVALWGASAHDAWAAYEAPARDEVGFVHFDGSQWADTPALAAACRTRPASIEPSARGPRMAGASATKIVATLGQGCTFSYDGLAWKARTLTDPLAVEVAITSVATSAQELFAVGDRGALVRFDDAQDPPWMPLFPALREDLEQVQLAGIEPWALASSLVVRLVDGRWETVERSEGATAFTIDAASDFWFSREIRPQVSEIVHRHASIDEVAATVFARVLAMVEREGTFWLAGTGGFVARGDGRAFETLTPSASEAFSSIALVSRDTAIVSVATPIAAQRFARKVLRVTGSSVEVLVADESSSDRASVYVSALGEIWVGGLPPLRLDGNAIERVATGDDAPVDAIASAGGSALWLAGGGRIRSWDGTTATRVFSTGRRILALASTSNAAWAVGEQGATLVFDPVGPSLP